MRLILLLLGLTVAACDRQKPEASQEQPPVAQAEQRTGVDRSHKGTPAPAVLFNNPDGGEISLASFKGVPVLVNLWATWCGPCVKELPTLQALEDRHAVDGQLGVIAVSQDIGPQTSVKAFLADKKLREFAAFHDPEMGLTSALGVQIMPTSVLYDAEGREVWRYVGDLDWTSEEAARLLAEARSGKT